MYDHDEEVCYNYEDCDCLPRGPDGLEGLPGPSPTGPVGPNGPSDVKRFDITSANSLKNAAGPTSRYTFTVGSTNPTVLVPLANFPVGFNPSNILRCFYTHTDLTTYVPDSSDMPQFYFFIQYSAASNELLIGAPSAASSVYGGTPTNLIRTSIDNDTYTFTILYFE